MNNVKRWCFVYEDRDTGETIKVRGFTDDMGTIFGTRQDPSLMGKRLRFVGVGTCNVTGYESAKTVPEFSYATV